MRSVERITVAVLAAGLSACGSATYDGGAYVPPDVGPETFHKDAGADLGAGDVRSDVATDGNSADGETATQADTGPGFVPHWEAESLDLGEDFVLRAVWGTGTDHLVAVGNKATIIERHVDAADGAWTLENQNVELDTLNGVWGASIDDVWAVGAYGAIMHRTPAGWNAGTSCASDLACDLGDPCVQGKCTPDGKCLQTPTGKPGCCGTRTLESHWDDGSLAGWTVAETASPKTGVVWNVTSHVDDQSGKERWTSPKHALYFGNPDAPCAGNPAKRCPNFDGNGQVVGATATSTAFALPKGAKVKVAFQVFVDTETGSTYDLLELRVVKQGVESVVWTKEAIGGTTSEGFVKATADLSAFAGDTIQLRLSFNSVDGSANNTEGVYVDDLIVDTQCGAGNATGYPTLWGVWGTASDNVFAVGNDGTALRFDGTTWRRQMGGDQGDLFGLGGDGTTTIAVGTGGTVFADFGKGLASETLGTKTLRGVAMHGGVAWVVGDEGTLLRHDTNGWTPMESGTKANLNAVWTNGTLTVAGGAGGVTVVDSGDGFKTQSLSNGATVYSIWGFDATHVYAVGSCDLHLLGASGWADNGDITNTNCKTELRGLIGFGADKPLLAVGGGGTTVANPLVGWSTQKTPTTSALFGVWGTEFGDLWAVGNGGVILRWGKTGWTSVTSPTKQNLYAVWGRSASDIFAAGQGGVLLHWDGALWSTIRSSTTAHLRAVWGLDASHVYAVGTDATIMMYNGQYWSQQKVEPEPVGNELVPVKGLFLDVWGRAADDIWVIGADGILVHAEISAETKKLVWLKVNLADPNKVTMWGATGHKADTTEMLLVGREGTVLRFNGVGYETQKTGSIATLYDTLAFKDGSVVAVGDLGTVLRWHAKPPAPPKR